MILTDMMSGSNLIVSIFFGSMGGGIVVLRAI